MTKVAVSPQVSIWICPLFDQVQVFHRLQSMHSKHRPHQFGGHVILSGNSHGKVSPKFNLFWDCLKELQAHCVG